MTMHENERSAIIKRYLTEVVEQFNSGQAKEHAYRPALQRLMSSFEDTSVINDPKRSEHGAPDFVFQKKSNPRIIKGYAEAKDIDIPLDKVEKTEQMNRYRGYSNLILTNYLDFRFFRNGEKYQTISIGRVVNGKLHKNLENGETLVRELEAFLSQTPESITSGLRLAQIMGGRARRIRDNVSEYLKHDDPKNKELVRIYQMMKELLVHDLEPAKFADMYAQTLVYGLFVARYSDTTPDNFTRNEARDLVPKSNPFLLQFFDHIVGPNFDTRLAYIVDELCEIFSVSDVQEIVHRHLRIQDETTDEKDPIIHFYEDFLQAYDPAERKKMGAYYTPIPVVRYIVRQVDRILKEDFGIAKGLASDEMITRTVAVQPYRRPGERVDRTTTEISVPRVQILDPAVGTATFLNETIKLIYQSFKGQEGRWPAYVNQNLLKRLYGFELMMAPYTIAHMKLNLTLRETGVEEFSERIGVYLTNTLEEGVPLQPDLFSFGLAEAVSEESRLASQVKSERPVMVVIGNPPYSVSSSNKSEWIQNLIADYKVGLNERKINLDDDYIKFIRFAEHMISKNGSGIVGMITNNSYIDGITHRQMRKHLLETFDKIYIIDLHGSAMKKEVAPDGGKDENVFNIMQGVSIVLMVKNSTIHCESSRVYFSQLWGSRNNKFDSLSNNSISFSNILFAPPFYFYTPKDNSGQSNYESGISLNDLFTIKSSGFRSGQDEVQVSFDKENVIQVVDDLIHLSELEYREKYRLKDGRNHNYAGMKKDVGENIDDSRIIKTLYRPFDVRWTYYSENSSGFVARPRNQTMKNFVQKDNVGLIYKRGYYEEKSTPISITNLVSHERTWTRPGMQGADTVAPLYTYHADGTRTINFDVREYAALTQHLNTSVKPEDVMDYVYAKLHSESYCTTNREFLRIDFPRIPIPTQAEFDRLVPLGRELRELHLMKSPLMDAYETSFPVAGESEVEIVRYASGKVWINKTQYFGNVPELAWNFYIGGYQPAQKWLKDRKGRKLSDSDLVHYQRIIKILLETDRIMKLIG